MEKKSLNVIIMEINNIGKFMYLTMRINEKLNEWKSHLNLSHNFLLKK